MTFDLAPSRRALLAGAGALAAPLALASGSIAATRSAASVPANPLVRQRADAQIFKHRDGQYYMTASAPEYDRLAVRRAPTLAGLSTAEEAVIWRRPASGKLGGYIWAPELHEIDGRWHMYFAAGDADEPFHIRTYVLRCLDRDALTGRWEVMGQFQTPWDTFTLDSTIFSHNGVRYVLWAQQEPGIKTNSNLYLAPLKTATSLAKPPARLTVPALDWEIRGFKVAEGPAPLIRNGKVFISYSASATDDRYCLGLLSADADADLMSPDAWGKSPDPVFTSCEETRVWGPGHNSFTVDEQGRDVLIYHGRDYKEIKGDPLFDPNRHTRVQRFYYKSDGTPDFGAPVGAGAVPDRFSPLDRPEAFLRHEGEKVVVGAGPLPTSQFREVPSPLGAGAVSLEPILKPGHVLAVGTDGAVLVAPAGADPKAASFRRAPGLADARAVSFAAVGGGHLGHRDGVMIVGPVQKRSAATFRVT